MAPKLVSAQNRNKSKDNIFIDKLNQALIINNNLRKRIEELSDKNEELSTAKNNLSLEKLSLQNEINSIKNSNIQLTAMHNKMNKKLTTLEQTVQSCIPALVTMSQNIPSILESIREMSKVEIKEFNQEKKKKQTKTVLPMINGMVISTHPSIFVKRCDDSDFDFDESPVPSPAPSPAHSPVPNSVPSPVPNPVPSPSTEQTPRRPKKPSYRSSPQPKLNTEPYVRLKDVAAMLKNSKTVPNKKNPQRQLNESLGEGPSWLHNPENQTQNSNNAVQSNTIQNVESSPKSATSNEVQVDVTRIASTSSSNTDNISDRTEERHSELESPNNSTVPRNNTRRKRSKRSSESSSESDIDDSTSSSRPSRSATKNINYKEKSLGSKFRKS
ncbi:putative uncharacterized protein DDB_G0290521 [Melanaphis sacchari]|uniref:putative uncharacterized protein DDB_G0290521 n=1 Tax=Melanaphis sacchari TaxID=742174 RepID=UPI000DC14CD7|nr:putative uncharacterized protein DDB_G0290521 [Melanaphis sacchari]XP_025208566.1 putative uncharacterized protein DDB_G0290521 [Melanaphis sacchari]